MFCFPFKLTSLALLMYVDVVRTQAIFFL